MIATVAQNSERDEVAPFSGLPTPVRTVTYKQEEKKKKESENQSEGNETARRQSNASKTSKEVQGLGDYFVQRTFAICEFLVWSTESLKWLRFTRADAGANISVTVKKQVKTKQIHVGRKKKKKVN